LQPHFLATCVRFYKIKPKLKAKVYTVGLGFASAHLKSHQVSVNYAGSLQVCWATCQSRETAPLPSHALLQKGCYKTNPFLHSHQQRQLLCFQQLYHWPAEFSKWVRQDLPCSNEHLTSRKHFPWCLFFILVFFFFLSPIFR